MRARPSLRSTFFVTCFTLAGFSAVALEAPQVSGNWRVPGGNCATPYLQIVPASQVTDGALAGTFTRDGTVVKGRLVLAGARRGQFVSETGNVVLFGVDPRADKLNVFPLAAQYLPWGDVSLERCP